LVTGTLEEDGAHIVELRFGRNYVFHSLVGRALSFNTGWLPKHTRVPFGEGAFQNRPEEASSPCGLARKLQLAYAYRTEY
jgi:hypothetical protein